MCFSLGDIRSGSQFKSFLMSHRWILFECRPLIILIVSCICLVCPICKSTVINKEVSDRLWWATRFKYVHSMVEPHVLMYPHGILYLAAFMCVHSSLVSIEGLDVRMMHPVCVEELSHSRVLLRIQPRTFPLGFRSQNRFG